MKLVATRNPPAERRDRLAFVRADGSASAIDLPRQGVLPHDLVHYVVETGLRIGGGFLSLVARGAEARFAMDVTHDPARPEAERSAYHAEAVVEALQTQLWAGAYDHDAFVYGVRTACASRGIEPRDLPTEEEGRALFGRAVELNERWAKVAPTQSLALDFPEPA